MISSVTSSCQKWGWILSCQTSWSNGLIVVQRQHCWMTDSISAISVVRRLCEHTQTHTHTHRYRHRYISARGAVIKKPLKCLFLVVDARSISTALVRDVVLIDVIDAITFQDLFSRYLQTNLSSSSHFTSPRYLRYHVLG